MAHPDPAPARLTVISMSSSTHTPRVFPLVVCVALSILVALPALGGLYIATRQQSYSCQVEVAAPSGAATQGEYLVVEDRLTLLPLGLACDYHMQDGSTTTVGPGWFSTAVISMALLGCAGLPLVRVGFHRRSVRASVDTNMWKRS